MISNYLKIAFRNLVRHKGYSFLNIAGLALGMACSMLIVLYVRFEMSFDRFHENSDRIYRVIKKEPGNEFLGSNVFMVTQFPLGESLKKDFPEVEEFATLQTWRNSMFQVEGGTAFEQSLLWATPSFFEVFSYEFLSGDSRTALAEPFTAVITQKLAQKVFGADDPMGKVMRFNNKYDLIVRGVLRDVPENSHIQFDVVTSSETYLATTKNPEQFRGNWSNSSYYNYFVMREGASVSALEAKLPEFVQRYMGKLFEEWGRTQPTELIIQPLVDIHLFSRGNFDIGQNNDIKNIYVLSAIALVLLLTACINYMNLATARASLRAKEVGVRKVVGAQQSQLMKQFLGESLFFTMIGALVAVILVELLLPFFSNLVDREFDRSITSSIGFFAAFIAVAFLVGIVSGAYPAMILASFRPVFVLKGATGAGRKTRLRNILVVAQFAASVTLIISTIVILRQLDYIRSKEPGYQRQNVVVLSLRDGEMRKSVKAIQERLLQHPGILSTTSSSSLPTNIGSQTGLDWTARDGQEPLRAYQCQVDYSFLETFKIELVEGRNFSPDHPSDTTQAFLINETFKKAMGWEIAVGQQFGRGDNPTGKVIGVMKDFHLHSLHQPIHPLFMELAGQSMFNLSIRIRPENIPETLGHIGRVWGEFSKSYAFEYTFLDEEFNRLYKSETRMGAIVSSFASLSILIACLGLFGLAAFVIEQRRKEIGIRKVLGATMPNIVVLLSREFLRLVVIANILAWPLGYYIMDAWLQDFAYRVPVGFDLFILSMVIAVAIAFITVSYQSIRASISNPVEALRYE